MEMLKILIYDIERESGNDSRSEENGRNVPESATPGPEYEKDFVEDMRRKKERGKRESGCNHVS